MSTNSSFGTFERPCGHLYYACYCLNVAYPVLESEAQMPQIFISYRREESADLSGRIGDYLERQFGSRAVFRDVNAILAGSNFVKALQRALDDARVMLVIIGPQWIHM